MEVLISPTEPLSIRQLGRTSSTPETFGADVLMVTKDGLCGVQRKELSDLVASLHDGRVSKELGQQEGLGIKIWLIEGKPLWSRDGESLAVRGWSKAQQTGLLLSLLSKGCWTLETTSLAETISLLSHLKKWLEKSSHQSLFSRPMPTRNSWGTRTNRSWAIHLLQSFPGIGPGQAAKIFDHFGRVPLRWEVTEDELMDVEGIGQSRAQALIEGLM